MAKTNHVNIADSQGRVYCDKTRAVEKLDNRFQDKYCGDCPFYNGSAQGQGVECSFDDPRYKTEGIHVSNDPYREQYEISSTRLMNDVRGE